MLTPSQFKGQEAHHHVTFCFFIHSVDETPLVNLLKEIYGRASRTIEMSFIRRIFNEVYVNVISDIKSKAESTDDTPIRRLAPAERSERLKQQQET